MYPNNRTSRRHQQGKDDATDRAAKARADLLQKRRRTAMMEENMDVAVGNGNQVGKHGKQAGKHREGGGGGRQLSWVDEGSLGKEQRNHDSDSSSSESEEEEFQTAAATKKPRFSPDAVSEMTDSKSREYEESLAEKDEKIEALERENQELRMITSAARKIKAKSDCGLSEDQVKDIDSQVGGLIRMVLLRLMRSVDPEDLIWSDEPDTVCGIVMSKLQLSTNTTGATKRALWEMVIAPRFGRKFGLLRNRQVQEMRNVFSGKSNCKSLL